MSGYIVTSGTNDAIVGENTAGTPDTEGFAYLLDNLQADLPGLVEAQARMALLNAAREFCQRTNAWVNICQLITQIGAGQYTLQPDYANTRVLSILACSYNGLPISPASVLASGMVGNFAVVGTNTAPTGTPAVFSLISPNILQLVPTPNAAVPALVAVSVMPVAEAGVLPIQLTEQFFDALLSGAKARLHAMPGRPYTSAPAAQLNMRIFTQQRQLARAEALAKYTTGLQDWTYPFFGARKRVDLGGNVPVTIETTNTAGAVVPASADTTAASPILSSS